MDQVQNQPLATIENAKEYMLASFRQFESIVGNAAQCKRFFALALNVLEQVPRILQCPRNSFRNALVEAARLDLEPNTVQQHCWIIPRAEKKGSRPIARLEMGYRGLVQLVLRDGGVKKVWSNLVFEGDRFDYDGGTDTIDHVPHYAWGQKDLGMMKGAYACAVLASGETQNARMDCEALDEARKLSRSSAYDGPFAAEMYKKTPLKRLCKLLPLRSPDVARVADIEDEHEGVVPDPVIKLEPRIYRTELTAEDTHGDGLVPVPVGVEKPEPIELLPQSVEVFEHDQEVLKREMTKSGAHSVSRGDASEETRQELIGRIFRTWERLGELNAQPSLSRDMELYVCDSVSDADVLEFANSLTRQMLEAEREQHV